MGLSLARKWARTIFRSRPARPQPRRPRGRTRLLLECLEDRTLPSTVTWINPGGGDWDTASNWQDTSTGQNRLPTAADDAVISQSGITVTHSSFFSSDTVHSLTSAAALSVSNGSLTFDTPSTTQSLTLSGGTVTVASTDSSNPGSLEVGTLTQSGGSVTGPGTLTVDSSLVWTGGSMSGSGSTEVNGTGEVGGGSPFGPTLSRTLDNFGTFTIDSGSNLLFSGGTLNNQSGGQLTLQGNDSLGNFFGSSGKLSNAGTLVRSGLPGTTSTVDVAFDNSGTVDVQTGTLSIAQGLSNEGSLTLEPGALASVSGGSSSGDFNLGAGSHLTIGGTFTLQNGSTTEVGSGGQFELDSTVTQQGGASVTTAANGLVNVGGGFFSSGNYILLDGASVTGPGVVSNGGTVTFNGAASIDNLVSSGNVTSNGAATVGSFNMSGGTVTVNAKDSLEAGTLTQGGGTVTGAGTLTVDNALVWTGGVMSGSGSTEVNGTGEVGGGSPFGPTLSRTLDNFGTFTIDSGSNLLFSGGTLNNQATGTLILSSGTSLGNFFGSSGKLVNAGLLEDTGPTSQATIDLNQGVTNSGTIALQGVLNLQGSYTQTSAGTLTIFLSPGSPVANGRLNVSGPATLAGTLNVDDSSGATPTNGQTFTIMTYSGVTGDFTTFTGLDLGNGVTLTPSRNATSYTLKATTS